MESIAQNFDFHPARGGDGSSPLVATLRWRAPQVPLAGSWHFA